MLIHRGRGGLVALIAFVCLVVLELYTRAQFHDDHYFQQHGWPRLAAFLLAALIVWWLSPAPPARTPQGQEAWFVSSSLTTPGPAGSPGMPAEGSVFRPRLFRPTDSLCFIPVRYWPPILCVLGVVFALIPVYSFY